MARKTAVSFAASFLILLFLTCAATAQTIDDSALMQPEALATHLKASGAKPTVLFVGPKFLFAQAHIAGAEFIGPASNPDSMTNLRKRVGSLPKTASIVLYCGCWPWDHCPNIRPAYAELHKLGYTNVKALYMATSLGKD